MILSRSLLPAPLVALLLVALGVVLCLWLGPAEVAAVKLQLLGFPDSDITAHGLRPWILRGLCFLPAAGAIAYCCGGTLDRYISRQFLAIFTICLAALITIWLLMDLTDNIGDFLDSKHPLRTVLHFYVSRSPAMLLLLLPYSLLLALLYALGSLSSHREIIAMVQAGRGIIRITLPLLVWGGLISLWSLGMNYHWAPTAEGSVKEILAESTGKLATDATNVLYRDPAKNRLWWIGAFPRNYQIGKPLLNVEVTTSHPDNTLDTRLFASRALWDRQTQRWTFEQVRIGRFQPGRPAIYESPEAPLVVDSWPETPWQLIKPGLSAAFLGIPDLNSWLRANAATQGFADAAPYTTHWHYRWAQPFACLITVLLATPLAVHFARRGPGGGIFLSVVLSALMLLTSNISVALGEAGKLPPALAAWLPNIAFGLLGLYLFRRRITGRPIYLVLRRLLPGND